MKLITLNTWGGRAGKDKLLNFFAAYRDTDIFCLQEIWAGEYKYLQGKPIGGVIFDHKEVFTDGLQQISKKLLNHTPIFHPNHGDNYGLLTLVNKELKIQNSGDIFVHKEKGFVPEDDVGKHARNIQYVEIKMGDKTYTIINFHGLWNGQGKGDSEDRMIQSRRVIEFLKTIKTPYIFCGDFNLLPETQSLKMFEEFGIKNLVKQYNITSTRTSLYKKEQKHANYVFVSQNIKVKNFKVLPEEVSDHSPLYLEFE